GAFLTRTPGGTPGYIAPEVLAGAPFTAAADTFSFGVTIHELFTGIRPAAGERKLSGPSALPPLINQMIAMDPRQRPDIGTVRQELANASEVIASQQRGLRVFGAAVIIGLVVAVLTKERSPEP